MPLLPGCPYVFWHPKSQTRWHNVRKVFNKAREDANLDWLIIKDLRRHYGIVLSENGAEMHVIQAMLGIPQSQLPRNTTHTSPHTMLLEELSRFSKGGKREDTWRDSNLPKNLYYV